MKFNKKYLIAGVLLLAALIGSFAFFNDKKVASHSVTDEIPSLDQSTPVISDVNISDAPTEAVTQKNADLSRSALCQTLKANYANIEEIKKNEKADLRFFNIHKKVDGIVYRLRFFYKDSSENEIPTYLVYTENQNDEDILTEKSAYHKGKLYKKVEKAQGEMISFHTVYRIWHTAQP